jgi:alpha-glucosidase
MRSNRGAEPVPMPKGDLLLARGPLPDDGGLPPDTATWTAR